MTQPENVRRDGEGEVTVTPDAPCAAARHGTRAAYVGGCRCPEAVKANREYATYRDRRTAHAAFGAADPFSVPAADAVAVIEQLRGTGWSLRRIEAATGIRRDHVARIYGKTGRPLRRVRWATYQRLRALLNQDVTVPGAALVDAFQTWQRIHGLIALGYPKTWIAQQLGAGRALQLDEHRVMRRNAVKVQSLADTYGGVPGPSDAARAYAAARGWTPDLIWQADEGVFCKEMHNCQEQPADVDDVAVERYLAGEHEIRLNRAEKTVALAHLVRKGYNLYAAAARLGINGQYARQYAAEAGIDVATGGDDEPMNINSGDAA